MGLKGILGSLVIELAANTARLQSDMGKAVSIAERGAAQIKKAFTFVSAGAGGGLIGEALIGAANQAIELGDSLNKAAIKAGIGAKQISELAYAAKLADVDLESLSTALRKMQIALSEAATGAKDPNTALRALGLTLEQVQRLKPEEQFALLGDRISKLKDPTDRARSAVEWFGKAGADLLPLFADGAEGLARAAAEARRLGYSFTQEQLKSLADADDSVKRLKASWEAFSVSLSSKVAPAITATLDGLSSGRTAEFAKRVFLNPIGAVVGRVRGTDGLDAPKGFGSFADIGGSGLAQDASTPPGSAAIAAADAAAAAAKKAAAAQTKEAEERNKELARLNRDMYADLDRLGQQAVDKDLDRYADAGIKKWEDERELQEKIAELREEMANRLSAGAQLFKDSWTAAFDAMVSNGKLKFSELLKYFAVEFAKRGFEKFVSNLFSGAKANSSSSGSGSSGFWSLIGSAAAATFSGARAGGGPVSAGRSYLVGEKGRELFVPNSSGSIVPNGAMGGGVSYAPVYNIDARGATVDTIKLLPKILRAHGEQVKADLIDGIRRKKYDIGMAGA